MKKVLIKLSICLYVVFKMTAICMAGTYADNYKATAVYFYSSTCSSCHRLNSFLEDLQKKYEGLHLIKYNISDISNKRLLDKYNKAYGVTEEDEGIVPVVFIRDRYFTGREPVMLNLENEITRAGGPETVILEKDGEDNEIDLDKFLDFKILSVIAAGFVNGINPCSMSMLLFFISLPAMKKENILKAGLAFCSGKFLVFLLLGTVLFNFVSLLETGWTRIVTKIILMMIIFILIFFNIKDYFAAKAEKYDGIRLQLPVRLRKFNHGIIKKMTLQAKGKMLLLASTILGMIVSLGEFFCTGQIYLMTIVAVLHTVAGMGFKALIYLIVYNIAFITPLMVLTGLIYKGREIFDLSEFIRKNLPLIKLINALLFIVFAVVVLILY